MGGGPAGRSWPARRAAPQRPLPRLIELLERAVECIFFLAAVHRFGPPPRRSPVPRFAPPGFRRIAKRRRALFFRSSGVRARKTGLLERLARLIAALAAPERHIAYFFKRIVKGLRAACLVASPPRATALAEPPCYGAIAVDTS